MKRMLLGLPVILFVLSACASTRFNSAWRDPAYSFGGVRKMLVITVGPQATSQRVAEDAFVKNLTERGVQAIPSYTLSPPEAKLDEAGWRRLVAENQIDTVLVARLLDVKTVEREVPPTTTVVNTGPTIVQSNPVNPGFIPAGNYASSYNNNWYGYYQSNYQVMTTPGYTVKDTVAVVETKVFDAAQNKMVWTGSTNTQMGPDQNTGALIRQFAKIVVDEIYKQ
jgi:hypothetical protein